MVAEISKDLRQSEKVYLHKSRSCFSVLFLIVSPILPSFTPRSSFRCDKRGVFLSLVCGVQQHRKRRITQRRIADRLSFKDVEMVRSSPCISGVHVFVASSFAFAIRCVVISLQNAECPRERVWPLCSYAYKWYILLYTSTKRGPKRKKYPPFYTRHLLVFATSNGSYPGFRTSRKFLKKIRLIRRFRYFLLRRVYVLLLAPKWYA